MQTLEITDEQYAFIQRLRQEISEDVVGKYGFVREQDAVQFLIDNIDSEQDIDIDLDGEGSSSATSDVAGSVEAAIAGEPEPETTGESVSFDEGDDAATDSSAETDADADDTGRDDAADDDSDDGDDDDSDGDGSASDDDMLDEMMSLLETHDGKWEESSSADYRYTVTLPDGSTEDVQTKDDVRALLFKNYR
ncbi:hypothetical protein [Natronolimnobius baerhuensis]|uniref:Uncharacterized protein n=1 Tax=Natronolimnobius baerhuensis TaxID=253108 RepID=A0A202EE04_9EURY|nr:hypothetical protein [Natronolimnobius baerhuensis]OVE86240.1 hypothetical protein B2G88_05505 [Natronolimnobius baerhuensis]